MTTVEMAEFYPVLYHVAYKDAFESILKSGLLSTTALLDKFDVSGATREAIESKHRRESIKIDHPAHGIAIIRDQKPLHPSKLSRCLTGVSQSEWLRCLNRRVFFWTDKSRVETLLGARAYRESEQLLLEFDTAALLAAYHQAVTLCHKNSGQTRAIHPLGPHIFRAIQDWPTDLNNRTGSLRKAVVEVCVDYAVPDAREFLMSAEIRSRGAVKRVWP